MTKTCVYITNVSRCTQQLSRKDSIDFSLSKLSPGLLELLLAENGIETECIVRAKEWIARKTNEWKRETKWRGP